MSQIVAVQSSHGKVIEPSKYQKAILDWLKTGKGHGCCNAVAGSGKSSTLFMIAKALEEMGVSPNDVRVVVFGSANAKDLVKKFGKRWENSIGTLHSTGFKILQQHIGKFLPSDRIQKNKYRNLAEHLGLIPDRRGTGGSLLREHPAAVDRAEDFLKVAELCRLTMVYPSATAVEEIAYHHNLEGILNFDKVAKAIEKLLGAGEKAAKNKNIDFTDQIWLPSYWQLDREPWFKPYKFVLIDECQDLNATQLELSLMLAGRLGRLLYVGDPRQAIMGFAGADCDSYQNILDRVKVTELPLSLCYRCPKSHIELVNGIFPEIPIEAHPGARAGEIKHLTEYKLPEHLVSGDMVLCRKTTPLVTICIQLIAKGIAATVKGRNIADTIKRDLQEIASHPDFTYEKFNEFAEKYRAIKCAKYQNLDNEEELTELLNDKVDTIIAVYQGYPNADSIKQLEASIDALFSDTDDTSRVTLSTCHRAKGLEGDRVFILQPEKMPLTWRNQQNWQLEQENNLLYVALTRSKSQLFIVGNPSWCPGPEQPAEIKPVSDSDGCKDSPNVVDPTEKLVGVDSVIHSDEKDKKVVENELTPAEQTELTELERTIDAGFTSAAVALKDIHDKKLYRQTHSTFETYCKERWNFGDRYARNLLAASEVIENLKSGTNGSEILPTNERQVRAIAHLPAEEQQLVWNEAVATAPNGKVSGAYVASVAGRRSGQASQPSTVASAADKVLEKTLKLDSADLVKILCCIREELSKRGFANPVYPTDDSKH